VDEVNECAEGDARDNAILRHVSGKTMVSVEGLEDKSERVVFTFSDGWRLLMEHHEECCEDVALEWHQSDELMMPAALRDVTARSGRIDSPIGSLTHTFYVFRMMDWQSFTMSWRGESNGYYSERPLIRVFDQSNTEVTAIHD